MNQRRVIQFAVLMLMPAMSGADAGQAVEPQAAALMREHKCYLCHTNDDPLVGPAFSDVAVRYRGNPDAVGVVAARVRQGVRGEGPWQMPPHPEVSPDEATAIAQYILSLDPQRTRAPKAAPGEPLQPAAGIAPRS
jgi:cytochrome c